MLYTTKAAPSVGRGSKEHVQRLEKLSACRIMEKELQESNIMAATTLSSICSIPQTVQLLDLQVHCQSFQFRLPKHVTHFTRQANLQIECAMVVGSNILRVHFLLKLELCAVNFLSYIRSFSGVFACFDQYWSILQCFNFHMYIWFSVFHSSTSVKVS